MYGIKGYIFLGELGRLKINNQPFEAMTGYEEGHEFMQTEIDTINKTFGTDKGEIATGYIFLLVPEAEWKEEK